MNNLCSVLSEHAQSLAIRWGWKQDPMQPYHSWVLYVDISTGQVSFHTTSRGAGPDYEWEWDNVKEATPGRIISWIDQLLTIPIPQGTVSDLPLFTR
jgi:hypothetical protein